jgi:hypothetical protein
MHGKNQPLEINMDDRDVHREASSAEDVEDPAEATADSPDTGGERSVLEGEPPRGVTGTATGTDASTPGRITMGSPEAVRAAEYEDDAEKNQDDSEP